MKKLVDLAAVYFRRRTSFRLLLVLFLLGFWGYIEVGDLFPLQAHDLNYHAREEIRHRYQGGPFTFAFLGDTKNSPIFQKVVEALNRDQGLLFAVIGGDLVLYPEHDTFKAFLRQRRELKLPSLALPGNHDVAFGNMRLYYRIFGRMYYAFVLGDSKFIFLDNSNETRLGDEQMAWLARELADGRRYAHRFVFMHVPLWDPRDQPGLGIRYAHSMQDPDAARRLEDLLRAYRVTILFSSHIHGYYAGKSGSVPVIISGGGGAELVGRDPEHAFYHYVRVAVTKDRVTTQVVKIDKNVTLTGLEKYTGIAKLYAMTLGRIYGKYILMGLFLLTLLVDGTLEFLYQKKQHQDAGCVRKTSS